MTLNLTKTGLFLGVLFLIAVFLLAPVFLSPVSAYSPSYQCSDGRDNDGDGRIDGADYGCHSNTDDSEFDDPPTCPFGGCNQNPNPCNNRNCNPNPAPAAECSNGIDDDGDGFIDYGVRSYNDPSCSSASDNSESPRDDQNNNGNNSNLRISCDVSDTRVEEGDRVTFEVDIRGGRAPYDIDWDGDISGNDERERVTFRRAGEYDVEVEVIDANGNRDSDDCRTVYVDDGNGTFNYGNNLNHAPYFTSLASASARVNQPYSYAANAIDPDNDRVSYSLISGPLGMIINPNTGFVTWTPSSYQANTNQFATLRASDGRLTSTQNLSIFVSGPVAPINPVVVTSVTTKAPVADLEIFNLRVDNDELNNVIVSFNTNIPASSQVAYSLNSHLEDRDARNYENRVAGPFNSTYHQVNLGILEINRTYYLRAIATAGSDTEITSELAFVQLPNGVLIGDNNIGVLDEFALVRVRNSGLDTNNIGLASALGVLGALLFSPWLLLLIIIALLVLLYLKRDRPDTHISTNGPVEIKS